MYCEEDILRAVIAVRKQLGGIYTIKEFLEKFHKTYPYPSTTTLYRKYKNIKKLLKRAGEWEKRQEKTDAIH